MSFLSYFEFFKFNKFLGYLFYNIKNTFLMVIGDWAQSPKSIICNNTFIYKNKIFYKNIKNNNKKSKLIPIINSKNKNFKKKLLK